MSSAFHIQFSQRHVTIPSYFMEAARIKSGASALYASVSFITLQSTDTINFIFPLSVCCGQCRLFVIVEKKQKSRYNFLPLRGFEPRPLCMSVQQADH